MYAKDILIEHDGKRINLPIPQYDSVEESVGHIGEDRTLSLLNRNLIWATRAHVIQLLELGMTQEAIFDYLRTGKWSPIDAEPAEVLLRQFENLPPEDQKEFQNKLLKKLERAES